MTTLTNEQMLKLAEMRREIHEEIFAAEILDDESFEYQIGRLDAINRLLSQQLGEMK